MPAVTFTNNEARFLKLILSLDLDRMGFEEKDQSQARSALRKLRDATKANPERG